MLWRSLPFFRCIAATRLCLHASHDKDLLSATTSTCLYARLIELIRVWGREISGWVSCLTRKGKMGAGAFFQIVYRDSQHWSLFSKNQGKNLGWLPALLNFSMQPTYTQPFLLQKLAVQSVLIRSYSFGIFSNSFNTHLVKTVNSFLKTRKTR